MAMRWGWSVCVMLVLGCSQPNPAFDEPRGTSSSGSSGSTTSAGSSSSTGEGGSASPTSSTSATEGTSTTGGDTDPASSSSGGSSSSSGSDTMACDPPNLVCDGVCTDVTGDRDHCGSCNHRCPGNLGCVNSNCQPV